MSVEFSEDGELEDEENGDANSCVSVAASSIVIKDGDFNCRLCASKCSDKSPLAGKNTLVPWSSCKKTDDGKSKHPYKRCCLICRNTPINAWGGTINFDLSLPTSRLWEHARVKKCIQNL